MNFDQIYTNHVVWHYTNVQETILVYQLLFRQKTFLKTVLIFCTSSGMFQMHVYLNITIHIIYKLLLMCESVWQIVA